MGHNEITETLRAIAATEPRVTLAETDGRALRLIDDTYPSYEARIRYTLDGHSCCSITILSPSKPVEEFFEEFRNMLACASERLDHEVSA